MVNVKANWVLNSKTSKIQASSHRLPVSLELQVRSCFVEIASVGSLLNKLRSYKLLKPFWSYSIN